MHDPTFIFDGTNYGVWKIRMLNLFRDIDPILKSIVVFESIMPFRNAHELWTKLQDKYEVSNTIEDDCSPSTSGRDEFSSSSTSPTREEI